MTEAIKIGSVRFLNAWPLAFGLEAEPGVELRLEVPSALEPLLRSAEVDAALIPAIEYLRLACEGGERARSAGAAPAPTGFLALPVGAVASRGPIGSIRLFGYTEMANVRRVLLDPTSRTSNALARVLFERRWRRRVHFVLPETPGPGQGAAGPAKAKPGRARAKPRSEEAKPGRAPDAALVIGDAGLVAERPAAVWQYDLGLEWDRLVHRPFVYAFWVTRADADVGRIVDVLSAALRRGLEAREQLAARARDELGMPLEVARRHLLEQVHYEFGPRERKGLLAFYEMAVEEGIAPEGGRLRFPPGTAL